MKIVQQLPEGARLATVDDLFIITYDDGRSFLLLPGIIYYQKRGEAYSEHISSFCADIDGLIEMIERGCIHVLELETPKPDADHRRYIDQCMP